MTMTGNKGHGKSLAVIAMHLLSVLLLSLCVTSVFAVTPDLDNPAKIYYTVFVAESQQSSCRSRTDFVQYFSNGRDAYLAKSPAGTTRKYGGWCWKQGHVNCDKEVVSHGLEPWCQGSGCKRGVFNGTNTICNKSR